jgi:thymidylate synthase (FAD)
MKIIDQSYEIISLPDNLLRAIEQAGRVCYQSSNKIGCTDDACTQPQFNRAFQDDNNLWECDPKCPKHSSYKFIKMLRDKKHHAMIEFGDIIVRFITNRGVTHELVRHRLCSFAQESTRYVKYDGQMEFIRPVWIPSNITDDMRAYHTWYFACQTAEERYRQLLKDNWRPEQAREVLPNSLKTEIVVKANIREWRHIFQLRTSKKAHPQMRALMLPLLKELQTCLPVVFDDI